MKKVLFIAATALCISSLGLAQSAGNFNAAGTNANCAIGTGGNFNGGVGTLSVLETTIKTSSGNGVLLDIRPDLDTGLFTDTNISTTVPSASADVGIQVCVTVD